MNRPLDWARLRLAQRVEGRELLDDAQLSLAAAWTSLEDLRRLNALLFGVRATLHPLKAWLRADPQAATVLELGTGSGQLAQVLARWAAREGHTVTMLALDLAPPYLRLARRWNEALGTPQVRLLAGDGLALPLATQSVDYVISSLFLHHLDEAALRALFQECRRVARRGLLMSDLWRHPLPFYLYKLFAEPLLVRSPITRIDSTISFRRAYRPAEMARVVRGLLPDAEIALHFPSFRWVLRSRWG